MQSVVHMQDQQQLTRVVRPGTKSAEEILGYLQELSRNTADANVARVLDTAVHLPIACLGMDKSLLLRRSATNGPFLAVAARNLSQAFLDNCHLLCDDGIIQEVVASQGARVIEDVSSLPPASSHLCSAEGILSLACIPAVTQVGSPAVLICMRSAPTPFTVWELEISTTVANHVGSVLRLKQIDEGPSETSLPFEGFGQAAYSDYDLQGLLDQSLDEVLNTFRADSGSIVLREHGKYHLAAWRGLGDGVEQFHRSAGEGTVSGWVMASRAPLLLHGPVDNHEFPEAVPRPELVSAMSVPLVSKRKVLGLLNINSARPGRFFRDNELTLASTIAHHIAITIENAKLFEAARVQTRYFGNLYKIARTITSTLQLDVVLEMIMERLGTLVACDARGLFLHDQDTGRIQLANGCGIPDGTEQDYIDLVLPAAKLASSSRRPVAIPDLTVHAGYAHSHVAQSSGLRSAIVVPLTSKRKVVGFLAAFRRKPQNFPRPTVRLLLGLAELAAIAIENARLYERQLGIAHIAQKELTPGRFETIRGFKIGCKYAPAHQVGGDYYDLIRINKHKFGLVVADVAGRNIAAALHISMCKHALRALADRISSPAKLMQKMNRFIYDHTQPEAFISMFYAVLDIRRSTLLYSTAGHEPGLLLRAEADRVEQLSASGILLGIVPDATFEERLASMNMGDILLLYTDGLVDALFAGETDGLAELEQALIQCRLQPAQEMADSIHRLAMAGHTRRSPDDIAIVTLQKI